MKNSENNDKFDIEEGKIKFEDGNTQFEKGKVLL